jgi:hypothetical protein
VSKNDPPENVPDPASTIPGDFTLDQVLKGFEFSEERIERARRGLYSPYERGRHWDSALGEWIDEPAVSKILDPASTMPGSLGIPQEIRDRHAKSPLDSDAAVFGFEEDIDRSRSTFVRDIQLGLLLGAGTALTIGLVWVVLF